RCLHSFPTRRLFRSTVDQFRTPDVGAQTAQSVVEHLYRARRARAFSQRTAKVFCKRVGVAVLFVHLENQPPKGWVDEVDRAPHRSEEHTSELQSREN